ncbi:MAG: hypothetical protein COB41_09710 [Proteobacteria bacterium]|nr:hypothetical protein [bacterium AH-315-G11]PCI42396.1 MAG: hypothetical protein COB41_09710 [Pseudomonadota bacterium]
MNKPVRYFFLLVLMAMGTMCSSVYAAGVSEAASIQHSSEVLQEFNEDSELAPERMIETKRKHQILFLMGGSLLILILFAAGFGIAMGIFDKDVFVWHVLSAGLATTLAIAHGVVAFVWFYPS